MMKKDEKRKGSPKDQNLLSQLNLSLYTLADYLAEYVMVLRNSAVTKPNSR